MNHTPTPSLSAKTRTWIIVLSVLAVVITASIVTAVLLTRKKSDPILVITTPIVTPTPVPRTLRTLSIVDVQDNTKCYGLSQFTPTFMQLNCSQAGVWIKDETYNILTYQTSIYTYCVQAAFSDAANTVVGGTGSNCTNVSLGTDTIQSTVVGTSNDVCISLNSDVYTWSTCDDINKVAFVFNYVS